MAYRKPARGKRYYALETIRIEYALYGKETQASLRAYVENRVSGQARREAISKGLAQFKAKVQDCYYL